MQKHLSINSILTKKGGGGGGFVWKTATMRYNCEIFGSYISIDTMKREINKLCSHICLLVFIMSTRKFALYVRVLYVENSVMHTNFYAIFINNSPGRLPTEVLLVMGDWLFKQ